jgi:hypothetical protein
MTPTPQAGDPVPKFREGMSFDEWWDARGFEFGYDAIKAAHQAAREAWIACIALAPEEALQAVPPSPMVPSKKEEIYKLLLDTNSVLLEGTSKWAMIWEAALKRIRDDVNLKPEQLRIVAAQALAEPQPLPSVPRKEGE